ncbi:S1 family peptidase [Aeromicrobium sp. Leaf350]|uniref:S1 family peptidase n=1 Tax=Aeromicrobium sp. Leaf350 TaxID=2876565 RepID=UPI001E554201|nr:S1 family peptidase [Aeromicrobium sp. Leaf350]
MLLGATASVAAAGDSIVDSAVFANAVADAEESRWQSARDVGATIATVESDYPDDFAYAYFTDDTVAHVGFKAGAPERARDLLEGGDSRLEFEEYVGFTQDEYIAAAATLVDQVGVMLDASPDRGFIIGPDPVAGRGVIRVVLTGDTADVPEPGISSLLPPGPFVLQVSHSPTVFEDASYGRAGGTWLVSTLTGLGQCTSGFVAKRRGSTQLGVATAGHCPDNLSYYHEGTHEVYPLAHVVTSSIGRGDSQFHRSSRMMDAWFHADTNAGRPVLDVRTPYAGEGGVCAYGKTTGRKCGSAVAVNQWITTQTGTKGNQVLTNFSGAEGDSGGPLYGGNTAFGIVSSISQDGLLTASTSSSGVEFGLNVDICRHPVCS